MRDVYHYDRINKQTQLYGVIGDPVAHSLSPLVQNAAFEATGFDGVYLPFRVFRQFLGQALDEFQWLGVRGYSVTIPHKEAVLEEVPRHDDMVDEIGASNTLYRDERLLWHAANTDYESALAALRIAITRESGVEEELGGKKVLILGAGGRPARLAWAWSAPVAASPSPAARMPAPSRWRSGSAASRFSGRIAERSLPTSWSTVRRSACSPTSTRRLFR